MASVPSSSGKASLDSLGYRNTQLGAAGIFINQYSLEGLYPGVRQLVKRLIRYDRSIPKSSDTAALIGDTPEAYRIAQVHDALVSQRFDTAVQIGARARLLESEAKPNWTPLVSHIFGSFDVETDIFCTMQDVTWNAPIHPYPRAFGLTRPKPDYAIGFRLNNIFYGQPATTFTHVFMQQLERRPGLYLSDKVAPTGAPNLVYPFLLFEGKSAMNSAHAAANQLAHGLAFALGTLRKLREDASRTPGPFEPLIAFGIASSGRDWTIYVAHELQPGNLNGDVHLCRIWGGDLTVPMEAVEFLCILDGIRTWSVGTLRPAVDAWLQSLGSTVT